MMNGDGEKAMSEKEETDEDVVMGDAAQDEDEAATTAKDKEDDHQPQDPAAETAEAEVETATTPEVKAESAATENSNNGNAAVPETSGDDEDGDDDDNEKQPESTPAAANAAATADASDPSPMDAASTSPKTKDDDNDDGNGAAKTEPSAAPAPAATDTAVETPKQDVAATVPIPVLRGTISYDEEQRKHFIRGMWNYSNNPDETMRFDYTRNLSPDEDVTNVMQDGEFTGSFSVNQRAVEGGKTHSKIVQETFKLQFQPDEKAANANGSYTITGTGSNEFGLFSLSGSATPTGHGDGQYSILLTKAYDVIAPKPKGKKNKKKNKKKGDASNEDSSVLPDPSPVYETGVVTLRGNVTKEASDELIGVGSAATVTRITGVWASSLEFILADPQNTQAKNFPFEYEHKSSSNPGVFPVSGRYSGFFSILGEDGNLVQIKEKDVTLKFRKNNQGYHNVEGKGANAFGKYIISGTLTSDNVITIFRQFQIKKTKGRSSAAAASVPVTAAPPPINEPGQTRRPSLAAAPVKEISMDDVKVPDGDTLPPVVAPENGNYSAVSRGILRVNDDGSHGCQGKWAMTRDHLTGNTSSDFNIRLEAQYVEEAIKKDPSREFPLDSEMYKGSFQLKKGGGGKRYNTIVDNQVVMKFRKNTSGFYNVYGRGVNSIGTFNLIGTLIPSGRTAGQVELYRMYPPALLKPQKVSKPATKSKSDHFSMSSLSKAAPGLVPGAPRAGGLVRRESTRMIKMPSRLEDDDPVAQFARVMDKCTQILRLLKTKDQELGGFFRMPVDPIALNIPTYFKVVKEPMDLNTLQAKMDAGNVDSPEEFARLARLIFENAIRFNIDPTHSVHNSARNLLVIFNQKFAEVEKSLETIRKADDGDKKKGKGDKKRKRGLIEEPKSAKRLRQEEATQLMAANAKAMSDLVSAAPNGSNTSVTRNEFRMMLTMIGKLQQQVVDTHNLIAELSSDDPASGAAESAAKAAGSLDSSSQPAEKKKARKKSEKSKPVERPAVIEEEVELSAQDQEFLSTQIGNLPEEALEGLIAIIRAESSVGTNDDEIDLELDALPPAAQRKLFKYVAKFIKPPKGRNSTKAPKRGKAAKSQTKKSAPKRPAEKSFSPAASPVASPVPAKPKADSLFAFGQNSDSDSDGEVSDDDGMRSAAASGSRGAPVAAAKAFRLNSAEDEADDDDDDSVDGNGGEVAAASWTMPTADTEAEQKVGNEDDAWGAARAEAQAAKAREEDKRKREEKLKAEAEQDKKMRMAEAVDVAEKKKAERVAKEAEEARVQEEMEKKAEEDRQKAREDARKQVQSVEQTVDLDEERDLMKQLEQNYMDTEMGGASPSSDFGF
ncbi:MAG: hypothetical protein SGILL_005203 [Bacillariaceae sp.]